MFPLRDHNPSRRTPYVTYAILALNVLVFLVMLPARGSPADIGAIYVTYGLVPAATEPMDFITSLFMHGGWMHLIGNMLFLWIFGDNMEDELGHFGFIAFYLAAGVLASLAHVAIEPTSRVPLVGASGAIAGLMGGYLLLFPKAKVDVIFIFVVFFKIWPIPAWIVLGVWFGLQLLNGASNGVGAGVAYWAHVGGFVAGILMILPVWLREGGTEFWSRNEGHPPHPDATYRRTTIPVIPRKRT
ncbi:rhomboid family intramembrane serine protease [Alphaproteobacteria bacterium KMM 3653]|uniref:Rhomboid family intramembrane serine protease n=1 Tax=Harenicola maris TaxID=2841044 RepID=A0AAP2CKF9_9RHOB|nr:rhomboid family intramembrane serine protease [Harenicola maris]